METRGLFKRIAAITMAALTIVTSSGVDVNLLTANANELTKQATENAVDENTNKALQKKDAKVGAQAKLSFSTNEALKRAVDDAGFNIDVKTNKVTSAAIKYNQSLLTLGKDFTATAKRTSYTKNSSKYNYVFTVTVTGKGDYTGSTTRTGLTQVSTIKPKTTKKTPKKASSKKSNSNNKTNKTLKKASGDLDEGAEVKTSGSYTVEAGKWSVTLGNAGNYGAPVQVTSTNSKNVSAYYVGYIYDGNPNGYVQPSVTVKYNNTDLAWGTDFTVDYGNNNSYSSSNGNLTGTLTINPTATWISANNDKGCKISFYIKKSIVTDNNAVRLYLEGDEENQHRVSFVNKAGMAEGSFKYNGGSVEPIVKVVRAYDNQGNPEWEDITKANSRVTKEPDYSGNDKVTKNAIVKATVPSDSVYAGETITIQYEISASGIEDSWVTLDKEKFTYNGQKQTPTVTVKRGEKELKESAKDSDGNYTQLDSNDVPTDNDYYVTYANNLNAGEATVTVHGLNNYKGAEVTKKFTIDQKNVVDTSKVNINVAAATYDGTKKEPEVTITDTEIKTGEKDENQKDILKTLTRGTDYTLTYYNNDKLGTEEKELKADEASKYEMPYIKVVYQGNYTGTVYKAFKIGTSPINGNNVEVLINGVSAAKLTNTVTSVMADAKAWPYYNPVKEEYPDITLKDDKGNTLVEGKDYDIVGGSNSLGSSKIPVNSESTIDWPKALANWQVHITGKGNYSGDFTLTFGQQKLPLSDKRITVSGLTNSDGKIKAKVTYTSDKGNQADLVENTDYTISEMPAAGTSVQITLTAVSNGFYLTGTKTVSAGTDLATANSSTTANLRYTLYDPVTGQKISNTGMMYYGDNVTPHVEIEKKADNGDYVRLEENADFTVVPTGTTEKVENTNKTRHRMLISSVDGSSNLYGSKEITYDTYPYHFSFNSDKTLADAFMVTSNAENAANVTTKDIKIDFNPSLSIKVDSSSTTTSTYPKYSTYKDPNGQEKTRITLANSTGNADGIYWDVPSFNTVTLKDDGTDYSVSQPSEVFINGLKKTLTGGQILISGQGDNFDDVAIYSIGTPSITSSNYYVADENGKEIEKNSEGIYDLGTYTFNQQPRLPQVTLNQRKPEVQLKAKTSSGADKTSYDYTVTYKKGDVTYKPGESDSDTNKKDNFKATGTYSIVLNADEGQSQAYKGVITLTYKVVPKSGIEARFSKGQTNPIKYAGDNTPLPRLKNNDDDKDNKGPVLKVYDGNKQLTYYDETKKTGDYIVKEADNTNSNQFMTPGKKAVTIIGKGEYEGVEFSSDQYGTSGYYYVQADLSQLRDSKLYTVKVNDEDESGAKLETFLKTLYYDGNTLKTANGKEVSKSTISISTIGNNELDPDTDYTIDGLDDLAPGNRGIKFRGTNLNYCTGSISFDTTIVVSRSNLKWSRNGSTTITLPYKGSSYTLGSGLLAVENEASGGNISLDATKDTVKIIDANVSSTLKADKHDEPTKGESGNGNNTAASFTNPGTYTITITGPENSTGSTELTLKILYDLSTAKVTYKTEDTSNAYALDGHHYNYNGNNPVVTSSVKVTTKSGQELKNGTDFSVPSPDTDATTTNGAGRYKLTIDAKSSSSYTFDDGTSSDPLTVTYYIDALSLTDSSKLTILLNKGAFSDEKMTYDGEQHIPEYADLTVTYNDGTTEHTLTSEDYTIAVASGDWTNAGKHSIYIVGKGNYKGTSAIHEGTIVPFTLTKDNITADDTVYNGGNEVKPNTIKVRMNSTGTPVTLKLHTNYEAEKSEGAENKKVGTTGKVDITGIGNYTGTVRGVEFQIVKLDLNKAETNLPLESRDYTGAEIDPTNQIVVYYTVDGDEHGGQLKLNTDFTVSYQLVQGTDVTPKDAGDYTVILTAVSSSKVVKAGTNKVVNDGFTINPISLNAHASEFAVEDAKYTGTSVRPKVTRNGVKVSNRDYTLSDWKNDVKPSSRYLGEMQKYYDGFSSDDLPSVTVTGKGNYTGKIKLNFGIGDAFDVVTATQTERAQYDGKEHPPVKGQNFTVRYKGKEVSADWYNIVDNDNDYVNGGVKTVTLEANRNAGGFYGTTTFEYTISPNATTVWGFSLDMDKNSNGEYAVEYQGAAVTPGVKVYTLDAGGNQTVLDKSEYKVEYSNNTKAGTASVKVTPNNYSADRCANDNPLTFRILGADITGSQFRVRFTDGVTRRQYTGSSISPAVRVTMLGSRATVTLTQGTDFTVSYKNNTNAGKATATVTGIGSYTGTVNLDYAIWTSLTDKTTTITVPKQMYTGEPITELKGVTIKAGGNNLVLNTDYSLVISSSDSFRTKGTAAFTGKGDFYEGTRTINFDIGNDASMYNVIGVSASYIYDHQAHKPVPVITDTEGTVYSVDSVSYSSTSDGDSCINAGNVRMQIAITSHGQTVSIPYNYTIERRDINTATFTPIADVDYNGKAHTPNVRVTEGTRLLTGTQTTSDGSADYAVTYYNNIQPGKALVTVTGINNYSGVSNIYFNINVKEAPQMKVTAMPSGRLKVSWTKVNGVSGYRIFYSPQGGSQKQVNIGSSKKTTYLTGLTRGVLYTVGLQSYVRANGQNGYSSASVQQIATSTTKPKITSAKSTGKGKIKLTWKKVSNATAYMVYRKTSGSKKWTRVKTTKSTSFTNTGLKSGRKYTYKVISYKQSGVKRSFSKYSKGKTVRAK